MKNAKTIRITIQISEGDQQLIEQWLAGVAHSTANTHGTLTIAKLAQFLLEDVALVVRRPGSWEGSKMGELLASHGYEY